MITLVECPGFVLQSNHRSREGAAPSLMSRISEISGPSTSPVLMPVWWNSPHVSQRFESEMLLASCRKGLETLIEDGVRNQVGILSPAQYSTEIPLLQFSLQAMTNIKPRISTISSSHSGNLPPCLSSSFYSPC